MISVLSGFINSATSTSTNSLLQQQYSDIAKDVALYSSSISSSARVVATERRKRPDIRTSGEVAADDFDKIEDFDARVRALRMERDMELERQSLFEVHVKSPNSRQ